MTHTYCAPLLAFNYEGGRIALGPQLVIDELTDIEYDLGQHNHVQVPLADKCIRFTTSGVGPFPDWLRASGQKPDPDHPDLFTAWRQVRNVACALRLFKAGQFDATYIIEYRDEAEDKGVAGQGQPMDWPRGYDMAPHEGPEFAAFWHDVQPGFDVPWLRYGLERFDQANSRQRQVDSLVDLAICGEALFLGGERGELGYKLALRCAYYLGVDIEARRTVFEAVRRAYDLRSIIVHGDLRSDSKRVKGMARKLALDDDRDMHLRVLESVATEFEGLMRQSLHKAMQDSRDHPSQPHWNELVLGG